MCVVLRPKAGDIRLFLWKICLDELTADYFDGLNEDVPCRDETCIKESVGRILWMVFHVGDVVLA